MRHLTLTILLLSSLLPSYSQDYYELISKANKAYDESAYVQSGNFYELAFVANANPSLYDYYDAACSFSLANNSVKALKYLELFLKDGNGLLDVLSDSDFINIRNVDEYNLLIDKFRQPNTIYVDQFLKILLDDRKDSTIIFREKTFSLGDDPMNKEFVFEHFKNAIYDSGRLKINKFLIFEKCNIYDLNLKDIDVLGLKLDWCDTKRIGIENSKIGKLNLNSNRDIDDGTLTKSLLQIQGCRINDFKFGYNYQMNLVISKSTIRFNKDSGAPKFRNKYWKKANHFNSITINECYFYTHPNNERFILNLGGNYPLIDIRNSKFYCKVYFAQSQFSESVQIFSNTFYEYVDFREVTFPEFNVFMPFDQFERGLAMFYGINNRNIKDDSLWVYSGNSEAHMVDKNNFLKLINTHEYLYNTYRQRGDLESANSAYIATKDLYLKKLNHNYAVEGGFRNLFRLRLAQIMKFYTNHGTDPSLAILISFYIILIFAIFYFFFPSEWDTTSKARLIANFKDFRQKNNKGYVKPFFVMLGGFLLSLLNALTLSLNSFITLGFGTIPTTGLARYICIIQGFIGWFLLSIFTVALINQVLS